MTDVPAYDAIAGWYDEIVERDGFLHWLVVPAVLDLAGEVAGQRVCDLACGQGYVSRRLAARGASVVGVDVSTELVERAREYERDQPLGIDYRVVDVQNPNALRGETFDGVTCNMALIAIADLTAAVRSVRSVLSVGGWFVFSITHPCFQSPSSRWLTDDTGRRARAIYEYFDERPWRSANPNGVRGRVDDHHRTLSTYVNTLLEFGLVLDRLLEPQAPASEVGDAPDPVPALLVARCVVQA
jgi:ubiquinone/menaquinone biosynthesis C-methylase UbiE